MKNLESEQSQQKSRTQVASGLIAAMCVMVAACVHEEGESQLVWLQTGLESEFPDRGAAGALDLAGTASPPHSSPSPSLAGAGPGAAPQALASAPHEAPVPLAAPDDEAARPVIRVVGTARTRGAGRAQDHIEMTVPDEHARALPSSEGVAVASSSDPAARQEYNRGLSLLNAHEYDRALEVLQAFVIRWPEDANAEAAMYWVGECYLGKGELVEASEAYGSALAHFPKGTKVPDDLLKLGMTADRLGNHTEASGYFERLAREFPRSDAARRIPREHAASL